MNSGSAAPEGDLRDWPNIRYLKQKFALESRLEDGSLAAEREGLGDADQAVKNN